MIITKDPKDCVTKYDSSKAYGGYTLFAQHHSTDVWLIDMTGQIVHRWKMETPLGSDERLLANGNLVKINKTFKEPTEALGTVGGRLLEVDWDGNIVWEHLNETMHHDWVRLENGNTLINTHVKIPAELARKVKGGIPASRTGGEIWGAGIQEITPAGEVVWEWLGHEHFDTEIDLFCPLCPLSIWGYINGIDVFPNGDIVASVRHTNTVIIIDKKTGDIKWRWGSDQIGHQHHTTVLENGNVMVFDNGLHRPLDKKYYDTFSAEAHSRVVEINPQTNVIEWEYADDYKYNFYSPVCSSAERLPNGNTLICESTKGRIFEVTPDKQVVWEFFSPFFMQSDRLGLTNLIFRAHRYGYDFPGFKGKKLEPLNLNLKIHDAKVVSSAPKDVIMVVIDTLRQDHLGAYGNQWIKTPNFDAFAKESVTFTRCYPESMPTLPARRTLHTGRRTFPYADHRYLKGDVDGVPGWGPIPEDQDTLAELLGRRRYRSALISDCYHLFKPSKNFHRGFDSYQWIRGQEADHYQSGPEVSDEEVAQHLNEAAKNSAGLAEFLKMYRMNTRDRKAEEDYFPSQVFRLAADWHRNNLKAERIFMVVDCFDPHEPWDPAEKIPSIIRFK